MTSIHGGSSGTSAPATNIVRLLPRRELERIEPVCDVQVLANQYPAPQFRTIEGHDPMGAPGIYTSTGAWADLMICPTGLIVNQYA